MYYKFFFILLLSVSSFASAQTIDCKGALPEAQARQAFEALSASLSGITALSSEFKQESYLAALDITEISGGNIWYEKPVKLKWQYLNPEPQMYLLKGRELQHYNETDNIVTLKNIEQEVSSKIPLLILFGEQKISDSFLPVKACSQDGQQEFILKPVKSSGEDPIDRVKLRAGADNHVEELSIYEKNGNRNIFLFSGKMYNQELPPEVFDLKLKSGADVNDLRGQNDR